jgi:hypothetical protein
LVFSLTIVTKDAANLKGCQLIVSKLFAINSIDSVLTFAVVSNFFAIDSIDYSQSIAVVSKHIDQLIRHRLNRLQSQFEFG